MTCSMPNELSLAIDVGTGSVRAALMDCRGNVVAVAAREHEQIVPHLAGRNSVRQTGGRVLQHRSEMCWTRFQMLATGS